MLSENTVTQILNVLRDIKIITPPNLFITVYMVFMRNENVPPHVEMRVQGESFNVCNRNSYIVTHH